MLVCRAALTDWFYYLGLVLWVLPSRAASSVWFANETAVQFSSFSCLNSQQLWTFKQIFTENNQIG